MTNPDVTRWRKARGWTQPQAAAAFGVHSRTWAKWEYGERPLPTIARKLMDALDSIRRLEDLVVHYTVKWLQSESEHQGAQPEGQADCEQSEQEAELCDE